MLPDKTKMIFAIIGINIVMVLLLVVGFRIGMYYAGTGPERFGFVNQTEEAKTVTPETEVRALAPNTVETEVKEAPKPVAELSADELEKKTEELMAVAAEEADTDAVAELPETVEAQKPVPMPTPQPTPESKSVATKKPEPSHGRIVDATHLIGKSFYTVQVRSSYNRKLAEDLVKEFKRQGYFAFLGAREIKGREWFRINVGRFESKELAEEFKKKFSRNHNVTDAIVQHFQ